MVGKSRYQSLAFSMIFVVGLVDAFRPFSSIHYMNAPGWRRGADKTQTRIKNPGFSIRTDHKEVVFASPPEKDSDSVQRLFDYDSDNFDNEISKDDLEEIQAGKPPEWMVMQQLLGINSFTIILVALTVFFLSMNFALGPGWLGSKIGIPGTGSIQEVSPSLPGSIDLNKPEFRL